MKKFLSHHCAHCVCFKPLSEAIIESSTNSLHLLIATQSILHASGERGCSSRLFINAPHMIGLFDQISLLILFLHSLSPPSINASLRLALSCVEWAEQVSSRMSGRKESSEIMTGTLHNVEIGKKSRDKERWGEGDEKYFTYCMLWRLISL